VKTAGGLQFWGDVHYFHGYRIQQNIITRHYRLLDFDDNRLAFGKLESCLTKLEKIGRQRNLSAMCGKAVILVHGTESAEYLHQCIKSLDGVEEINLVVHSMGGLVVRCMLMQETDPRLKRMVMMGVPNNGAVPADLLKENPIFKTLLGPAGQELGTDEEGLIPKLPIPEFEFGVIAGGRGDEKGYNPLLKGDDDGTVSVQSTQLPSAADFMLAPVLHSFLMHNDECVEATLKFLETGKFGAEKR